MTLRITESLNILEIRVRPDRYEPRDDDWMAEGCTLLDDELRATDDTNDPPRRRGRPRKRI